MFSLKRQIEAAQTEATSVETYLERAVVRSIIPLYDWRVHDAPATVLPVYADDDSDDLQVVTPTIGTTAVTLRAGVTAATVTKEAIAQVPIPTDYVAGSAISIVIPWTRADAATTSSTLDVTVFRVAAPTVDIQSTAAQDINAAASGTATFVLTPTALVPGEQVLINLLVAVNDGTTSVQELTDVQWSYTPVAAA